MGRRRLRKIAEGVKPTSVAQGNKPSTTGREAAKKAPAKRGQAKNAKR